MSTPIYERAAAERDLRTYLRRARRQAPARVPDQISADLATPRTLDELVAAHATRCAQPVNSLMRLRVLDHLEGLISAGSVRRETDRYALA